MLKRHRPALFLVTAVTFLLLAGAVVVAQVGEMSACPDLVTQALEAVNTLCTGQGRNSACYGNNLVTSQFTSEQPPEFFSAQGDIAELGLFRSIETSPLNDALTEWGVSVLSVQANLPGALPGQNALFMLVGGTEVESAVDPANEFQPVPPIEVTAAADAPLLDAADGGAPVVINVTAGQTVLADAQSEGGAFVRVTVGEQFGWIARDALPADPAVDALPVYQPGVSFSPMQAFYLRTGIGGAQCGVAPSALVVQGPQDYTVNINANGANISLGSSLILESVPIDESKEGAKYQGQPGVGGLLRITVIDGHATITSDDGTITEIPEGYQSSICLTEPENLGEDGQANDQTVTYVCGGWTEPEQIPPEFREQYGLVDDFPLIYPLDILTPTPTFVPRPPGTATPEATVIPTETPWPVVPTDAPVVTGADLTISASAVLSEFGNVFLLPRFVGVGESEGGQYYGLDISITLRNNGPETANDVSVSGIFPYATEGGYETDTGEFDYQSNTWLVGTLAPGQTAHFYAYMTVFLSCGGSISSTLTIQSATHDPYPGTFGYSATADCEPPPPRGLSR